MKLNLTEQAIRFKVIQAFSISRRLTMGMLSAHMSNFGDSANKMLIINKMCNEGLIKKTYVQLESPTGYKSTQTILTFLGKTPMLLAVSAPDDLPIDETKNLNNDKKYNPLVTALDKAIKQQTNSAISTKEITSKTEKPQILKSKRNPLLDF
jgi:hypothetical protein